MSLQLSSPEKEFSDALRTYLEPPTTMSLSSFRDSWHPSQNVNRYSNTAPLYLDSLATHSRGTKMSWGSARTDGLSLPQLLLITETVSSKKLISYSWRMIFKKTHNKVSMLPISDGNAPGWHTSSTGRPKHDVILLQSKSVPGTLQRLHCYAKTCTTFMTHLPFQSASPFSRYLAKVQST